jgi:predicted nucleic acid-binding protein
MSNRRAVIGEPNDRNGSFGRDDEWVVACALRGAADIFVTGDHALLRLRKVGVLPIVSPREFWTSQPHR